MSQTVRKLLGQNLLVDFENYLEVHVKVYVKVVYSWFSWNQKKVANSRETVWSQLACVLRELSQGALQGVRQGCLQLVKLESKGSQTVERLLGQNLLVYFESYLEVHFKVYIKIVYS